MKVRNIQHEYTRKNNAPLPKLRHVKPVIELMGVVTACRDGGDTANNAISGEMVTFTFWCGVILIISFIFINLILKYKQKKIVSCWSLERKKLETAY